MGQLDDAEGALAQGIQAFEAERASLSDEGRISASDESWQLFQTSVQLALRRKDYPRAFAMAERARATTLAEARRLPANASLKAVQATLSPDQAIVALNQFEDELAIWLIRSDRTDVIMRPVSRIDAVRLAGRQRDEIRIEARTPIAGGALFDRSCARSPENLGACRRSRLCRTCPIRTWRSPRCGTTRRNASSWKRLAERRARRVVIAGNKSPERRGFGAGPVGRGRRGRVHQRLGPRRGRGLSVRGVAHRPIRNGQAVHRRRTQPGHHPDLRARDRQRRYPLLSRVMFADEAAVPIPAPSSDGKSRRNR